MLRKKYDRTRLKGGEVLLTLVGSVGQVAVVPPSCAGYNVARAVGVMRPKLDVGARWISYCLRTPACQAELGLNANTTVQTTINLKDVKKLPIPLPSSGERQAITAILSALDDRITLLRETNATLETIAQALFKSWFVDFDPVQAKAEGREPEGVPPEVVDLFPDELVESELGVIPKGWGVGTVLDLADINAWTLRKRDQLDEIKYIEISAVDRGDISEIISYARGDEPGRARRRLKHGDTVLSTVRPDRQAYFLAFRPEPNLLASTGFAVLTPKSGNWSFLHAALTRREIFNTLGNLADGGAYPAVRSEVIGNLSQVLPPPDLVEAFHRVANGLYAKCHHNRESWQTLADLRDTLLPRLMSGKLRVAEAEKELEAV